MAHLRRIDAATLLGRMKTVGAEHPELKAPELFLRILLTDFLEFAELELPGRRPLDLFAVARLVDEGTPLADAWKQSRPTEQT